MKKGNKSNPFENVIDGIYRESVRRGPLLTVLVMATISILLGYLLYDNVFVSYIASNREYKDEVRKKERENEKTEKTLADEPQFRAQFKKVVDLYAEAKPLLPEETEVSDVLGQVESAAQRNNVKLTGLQAVKQSVKSTSAAKLYEREIPALVTGTYPQVVKFFADISRMPRILLIRDYSVVSMKNEVSAGFTLVAFHAPPPAEMPGLPKDIAMMLGGEPK